MRISIVLVLGALAFASLARADDDKKYSIADLKSLVGEKHYQEALMPMGEAEGSLQVLPRSHLAGTLASQAQEDGGHRMVTFEPEHWVQPEMAAGDCIAFSRLTVHGSGANRSGRPRVAYAMQYHRNDVQAFFDDRWELLTTRPRFRFPAVDRITVPDGRKDGH